MKVSRPQDRLKARPRLRYPITSFILHGADLHHVARTELAWLARVDADAVHPRSVQAVQVLDQHVALLKQQHRVLTRAPDLFRRFLTDQIDINRFVGESADRVAAFARSGIPYRSAFRSTTSFGRMLGDGGGVIGLSARSVAGTVA